MSYCVVITTCESNDEAEKLATKIIKNKLAACVQLDSITSCYIWDGKINTSPEIRLMIKTKKALYDQLEQFIKDNHSYDVPEIIELPVHTGLKEYLDWIEDTVE